MTGPEHYKRSEDYLDSASEAPLGSDAERFAFNLAKVHAMLALAAATGGSAVGRRKEDVSEWDKVLGGGE